MEGVRFGQARFPEGKLRNDPNLGKLSEYEGKITVRVPGEVSTDAQNLPNKIAGLFSYQACKESCFPPEGVTFTAEQKNNGVCSPRR